MNKSINIIHNKQINNLKQENTELKQRLANIEQRLVNAGF